MFAGSLWTFSEQKTFTENNVFADEKFPKHFRRVRYSSISYKKARAELHKNVDLCVRQVETLSWWFEINAPPCSSYVLCTFPAAILHLNDSTDILFQSSSVPDLVNIPLFVLAMLPFATNPLLYVVSDSNYRRLDWCKPPNNILQSKLV